MMSEIKKRGRGDYIVIRDMEPFSQETIITPIKGTKKEASAKAREIDTEKICYVRSQG
jgi:hypothetical protein